MCLFCESPLTVEFGFDNHCSSFPAKRRKGMKKTLYFLMILSLCFCAIPAAFAQTKDCPDCQFVDYHHRAAPSRTPPDASILSRGAPVP
jgi:hypothetical protein